MDSLLFSAKSEDLNEFKCPNIELTQDFKCNLLSNKSSIGLTHIPDFEDEGFLLKNMLSGQECDDLIKEGKKHGFQNIIGAQNSHRNSQRIIFKSEEIADILWSRIQTYISEIVIQDDPLKQHILGTADILKGYWSPVGLNPCFRFCKYEPGGHFAPHFDGHLVVSTRLRSMKTFMLYLNEDFNGGTTHFVDECQTLFKNEEGKYCAEEKNILCRIKPETGMAIIFNHHLLHEGEAVRDGVKYILRTDIMFKKDDESPIDPKLEEAFQLIQEAERLEASGEQMRAVELYRKAYKFAPQIENSV